MSGIFGLLGLNESDYAYVANAGQGLIYEATQTYLNKVNEDMALALAVFVEGTTEKYTERYKLPGGGRLSRRGGLTPTAATKAYGSWDVAYPLEDFGARLVIDDVSMSYMSPAEYQRHIDTTVIQNQNTVRFEVLKALFNNTARTFVDPLNGSLTVQPLANGDAVTYPPVLGSEAEATDNHYLESNYAASAIDDTNNPYPVIRAELEEHFGATTGGDNIAVFIHPDEGPETVDLAGFDPVEDMYVRSGANTNVPVKLPNVPGKVIGRTDGVWVVEWRWIPSGWALGLHLDETPPLKMRVDPAATGLGSGLQLVARNMQYPLESAEWRHRFGVGCGNRLNGVVMEFGTGGTYTVPTAYA